MRSIFHFFILLCLAYVTNGGPVVKLSGLDSKDANDLLPLAVEAQELPVEKIENVQVNVGKMLDRSLEHFHLEDLLDGFKKSMNHTVQPILDRWEHSKLSNFIKHLKTKPILSHVIGDKRPMSLSVIIEKPNGHSDTLLSIPSKKFLHKLFHKHDKEHEDKKEEQTVENVEEVNETDHVKPTPEVNYASNAYTTNYNNPPVIDYHGRGIADTEDFSFEDSIYIPLKRDRRDVTNILYPDEYDDSPVEEGVKNTRPNKIPESEKISENTVSGHVKESEANKTDLTGQEATGEATKGPVKGPTKQEAGLATTTATKRPTTPPEKFIVTIEEHPLTSVELATSGPDSDPNVVDQEEFTAQEILQLAYKWIRKNVVFRI